MRSYLLSATPNASPCCCCCSYVELTSNGEHASAVLIRAVTERNGFLLVVGLGSNPVVRPRALFVALSNP